MLNWKKKSVLITGAGGFIGSHLVEEMVEKTGKVKCFIRYNSRGNRGCLELLSPKILKNIEIIQGDLKDFDAMRTTVKGVDFIFHLAALISIPYSYLHPRDAVETNIIGALNVLQASLEGNVERLINVSTSEVYGTAKYVPIDEKHPLCAQSPYSASKISAEKLAESFYRSFNLPIVNVRAFNTYGPRQSARAVIPTIFSQALSLRNIKLGLLSPIRDFTFIKDTVSALIKIAEIKKAIGETVNIGTGKGITIKELAGKIINMIDKNIKIVCDTKRIRPDKSEVMRLICDNRKLKKLTNWRPQWDLNKGLMEVKRYITENSILYKPKIYNI